MLPACQTPPAARKPRRAGTGLPGRPVPPGCGPDPAKRLEGGGEGEQDGALEFDMTTMTKRLLFCLAAGVAFLAGAARADTGQDPAAEEHAAAVPEVSAEERAELDSPFCGGGNWRSWLEHRGEADGWEGPVDLKSWWGGRKRASARAATQSAIAADKKVYGWLPYWATSSQISQFQWDKLTHVAYFSWEVNPTNGGCLGKHSWGSAIVQTAHSNGVKIHLTATLFNASPNKLLLQNTTACNALAQNLVNEVKNTGGDGVCIDFEGVGCFLHCRQVNSRCRCCSGKELCYDDR